MFHENCVVTNEEVWSSGNHNGAERQKLSTQPKEVVRIWSSNTDFQCPST